jgi:hypothetical protein
MLSNYVVGFFFRLVSFHGKRKTCALIGLRRNLCDSVTHTTLDMMSLILDIGVSISISPVRSDFITLIHSVQHINKENIILKSITFSYTAHFSNEHKNKKRILHSAFDTMVTAVR